MATTQEIAAEIIRLTESWVKASATLDAALAEADTYPIAKREAVKKVLLALREETGL